MNKPYMLDPLMYFALIIIAILIGWLIRLEMRLRRLAGGSKASDLEGIISELHHKTKEFEERHNEAHNRLTRLDEDLVRTVKGVSTVRFNPFNDQGGKQSFSTAILNGHGDGVVITGLYSREKSSVYAKPIKKGTSEYELSTEEREVISEAKQ